MKDTKVTELLKQACADTDCVTQDLAVGILADEEEHHCLFEGFLKSLKKEDDSCCR